MRLSKIHFFTVYCVLIIAFSISCEKEERHPIPDIQVYFRINLQNDPEFFHLLTVGTSVVIESSTIGVSSIGYNNNGVIVFNGGDNEFHAYDRTCPHEMPRSIRIETDGGSGIGTCPECGSKFVFSSSGVPTTISPSKWPLKKYNAAYNPNTGDLVVSH